MKQNTLRFLLIFTLFSCSTEDLWNIPACPDGDCDAIMQPAYYLDNNRYFHVDLDFDQEYLPRFEIPIEADPTSDVYKYNGVSLIEGRFDTDSYWVLGDSLAFTIPLYNAWTGLEDYTGTPIPVNDTIIYLNQFAGTILPLVDNSSRIYFGDRGNDNYTSKRLVGPVPPQFLGDTITIYMEVFWDAGEYSVKKDHYVEKFIIE